MIAIFDPVILRKQKQLTQLELAKLVGADRSMIQHIEKGRVHPSVRLAKKLASVLGCDWTEFYSNIKED